MQVREHACPKCNELLPVKLSRSEKNPDRPFFSCKPCNYFCWADAADNDNSTPDRRPSPRNPSAPVKILRRGEPYPSPLAPEQMEVPDRADDDKGQHRVKAPDDQGADSKKRKAESSAFLDHLRRMDGKLDALQKSVSKAESELHQILYVLGEPSYKAREREWRQNSPDSQ